MLKLKSFGHLMPRVDSLEKTLMLGGIGGRRRRGRQRRRWLDGITDSMHMSLGARHRCPDGQGGLACCDSWGHKESDTTEQLNWTGLDQTIKQSFSCFFIYQWMVIPVNIYKFLFHILSFHFWSLVLVIHLQSSVSCEKILMLVWTDHSSCTQHKLMISINIVQ